METPNRLATVRLALAVFSSWDGSNFFATLELERADVEDLLRRASVFRAAQNMDRKLYQMTYSDYTPEFFESGKDMDGDDIVPDVELDDASARLDGIFTDGEYPEDGFRDVPEGLPESGNVRFEYSRLVVADALSRVAPDAVEYHWEVGIKHVDGIVFETVTLAEGDVKALLGRLV
jgi:hypothetical protein